jgi:hypothetical protein
MELDERELREQLKPLLWNPMVDSVLTRITNDRNLLSLFLSGVSYLEGIGELAIGAIRHSELSHLMHDLHRHELEEHGHMTCIQLLIQELFPDLCEGGRHVFESEIFDAAGRQFYHKLRDTSRRRLRQLGRYSSLNLYLLFTFGGETLVEMLYGRLIDALQTSTLPRPLTERIEFIFRMILAQEDTHDVLLTDQHNKLLEADRTGLSPTAVETLDQLGRLTAEDYRWLAEYIIREFVCWMAVLARVDQGDAPAARSVP